MSHFIVIYHRDRRLGAETRVERIEDPDSALARLFELESDFQADPEMGVVMLVAENEDTVRATHSQYFKSLDELLDTVEA